METMLRALGVTPPRGLPAVSITSVQFRPDRCGPGALFLPIQAFRPTSLEAHAIAMAAQRGASAAFTNLRQLPFRPPMPVMRAGPTINVLAALARQARSEYQGTLIAITGSVGKTTTKDLTHHVLSFAGAAHKMSGNFNTLPGVCHAMINRPLASRFGVMELAVTRPGHMMKARLVRPHVGVVMNAGVSHLQSFSSERDILREKISLLDHLDGEGIGIVHRSVLEADDAGDRLIRAKGLSRLIVVGNTSNDDVYLSDATFNGAAVDGTMSVLGRQYRFKINLPARHFADNAMFALAVAGALGLDIADLVPTLATATASRFRRYRITIHGGAIELIDDAYNAAPASVAAMLESFGVRIADRKVLVLGDMRELGSESARFHEEVAPLIADAGIDLLVTVGDLARLTASGAVETVHFADAASATAALPSLLRSNDLVVVKASKAVGLRTAVAAILRMGSAGLADAWRIEDEA